MAKRLQLLSPLKGEPGDPGVYVGNTEPTDDSVRVWIDPDDNASPDVVAGSDGGYYIPTVTQPESGKATFAWTPSQSDMPTVNSQTVTLPTGTPGKSAYQYAQDGGYTGTEEEFAQKLASESAGEKWELIESGEITDADDVFVEFTGLEKYSEVTYGAMHIRDANGKSSGLKLYVNGVHIRTGGTYFIVYNQETYPTINIRKIGKNHIHVTGCGSNLNGPNNVNPYFDFSCPIPRLATTIQSVKFEIEGKGVYFTPGSTYELWGRV